MLDWLVLYAYHRLSNKMQAKVKNLVTQTLKVVSQVSQDGIATS